MKQANYTPIKLERIGKLPLTEAVKSYGVSFCKKYINNTINKEGQ